MADLFVSYASEDRARVLPLVEHLEKAGYSLWWDRQIRGGAVFSQEITDEIEAATAVVVLWTKHSLTSRWVADEAELALRSNKLVPLSLDGVEAPIGFRQIQTIDFSNWDKPGDPASQTLATALKHYLQSESDPLAFSETHSVESAAMDAAIAVLPFVNMSSDPEQEYFSDGISEELLNLLSKIGQLRVTARTSSFQFKGQNVDIPKVGKQLGVKYVLEGSVRKAGNRVRITSQLIDTANGFHLWSQTYDRTLDDIFAIQDEISLAIVSALKELVLGDVVAPEVSRSENIEAYEEYLFGQQLVAKRTKGSISAAQEHFKTATELDPDYAPALVGYAQTCLLLSNAEIFYGDTPINQAREQALPLLQQALGIDSKSEQAYTELSFYHHLGNDFEKAQAHAEKAIAINPNYSGAYRALGLALKQSGDPGAAIVETRRKAMSFDPLSTLEISNYTGEMIARGRFEEATKCIEKIGLIDAASPFYHWGRVSLAMKQGRLRDALAVYDEGPELRRLGWGLQDIALMLDLGDAFEHANPVEAVFAAATYGRVDIAERVFSKIAASHDGGLTYELTFALALCRAQEGHYREARNMLAPFDEIDPENWGCHFDLNSHCWGARLSHYCLAKLGDTVGADLFARKLRELHQVLSKDPEGALFLTDNIGAIVALIDGERGKALDLLECYVSKEPLLSLRLAHDPLLEDVRDDPRFQSVLDGIKARIAEQKALAKEDGLFP